MALGNKGTRLESAATTESVAATYENRKVPRSQGRLFRCWLTLKCVEVCHCQSVEKVVLVCPWPAGSTFCHLLVQEELAKLQHVETGPCDTLPPMPDKQCSAGHPGPLQDSDQSPAAEDTFAEV